MVQSIPLENERCNEVLIMFCQLCIIICIINGEVIAFRLDFCASHLESSETVFVAFLIL